MMYSVEMSMERAKELGDDAISELKEELIKKIEEAGDEPSSFILTAYEWKDSISMTATLMEVADE